MKLLEVEGAHALVPIAGDATGGEVEFREVCSL